MARRILIGLGVEVRAAPALRGTGTTKARILKQALHDTAQHWHDRIFPDHFEPVARTEYRNYVEPRDKGYIFETKLPEGIGAGRTVADILKGQSSRWMRHLYRITGTSHRAKVRMNAPAYFTHPFVGTITDPETGRTRVITRQPDKPAEVTSVSDSDRQELRVFYADRITRLYAEALTKTS